MLVERRKGDFAKPLLIKVLVAWALISAFLVAVNASSIVGRLFPDPDDIMRLVQVRDLIAGQSWFDVSQYRVDAPGGGVPMHWSRLVDLPIALVIIALTPLLGQYGAETAALVGVPLFTLGVAMFLAARIAYRLLGDEETTFTCLILAMSVPVLFQLGPMRIDHHGWQMVCALLCVNALIARSPQWGGWTIGAASAVWLLISIEGLPLAAIIFAVLALRWIKDRSQSVWLVSAIQGLAITSASLFAATRGFADLAQYCDAISPAHIAMFAWGAIVLTVLQKLEPAPKGVLFAGFALAGAGAIGVFLSAAPQCAGGGFAELDPMVAEYWHDRVHEGLPFWQQDLPILLQFAVTPLIGTIAAITLYQRSRDWLRQFWLDYAIILGGAFLVSLLVARAGSVACILSAPPLAWLVYQWLRKIRTMERPGSRVAAMLAVACALSPTLPLMFAATAMPAVAARGDGEVLPKPVLMSKCELEEGAALLNTLPKGEVYAGLDIAPNIILDTHHSVIATGHHRGNMAMRLVIETSVKPSEFAREQLRARGTSYVALCPNLREPRIYEKIAPQGFIADLLNDRAPEWLEPIPVTNGSTLKLWRVKPE